MMSYQMMSFSKTPSIFKNPVHFQKPRPFSKTPSIFKNPVHFQKPRPFSKTPSIFKNPAIFKNPGLLSKPRSFIKTPVFYQKPGFFKNPGLKPGFSTETYVFKDLQRDVQIIFRCFETQNSLSHINYLVQQGQLLQNTCTCL